MHSRQPTLPNDLAHFRQRFGFTQKRAATILGHQSPDRLSRYEHGRCVPTLKTALSLAVLYRVPVEFLFPAAYAAIRNEVRRREARTGTPTQGVLF